MVRKLLVSVVALTVPLALVAVGPGSPAAFAERSEQVVFSGTGSSTVGPVGFWVWCQVETSNPYETDCNGSMYFYALHLTKHVTGDVSEPDDDEYQMDLASSDGSIDCTLTNEPPILHGRHNTVDVDCDSPSATGSSHNAVVTNNG